MSPAPAGRDGLAAHEAAIARDLSLLNLPAANWPASVSGPDGAPALDVLVVGAGMLGIAAAAALSFKGIRNLQVLDRAPFGREGPWVTFARMETLRSPKHLTGPAAGIPSLTFRAWYEAQHGRAGWEALGKIPNSVWQDYLTWLRRALALPVRNGVGVDRVTPAGDLLAVQISGAEPATIHARHVVFATGRAGGGGANIPAVVDPGLWPDLAAHTSADIDFGRLKGREVAVLGGGASAWDNAATALEAGAARVDMFVRRHALPQVNKGRGSAYPGFFLGWEALGDAERWALMVYLEDAQAPPPHETVHRTIRHDDFGIHFGSPITGARRDGTRVRLATPDGSVRHADFLIVGTGFRVDLASVPELAEVAEGAATWGDRYRPPAHLIRPDLSLYPYLGSAFELLPKDPASPGEPLSRIHLFNYAAHASHRQLSGDVPGVDVGAEKLSVGIGRALFREDIAHHRRLIEDFAEPELESTPFFTLER